MKRPVMNVMCHENQTEVLFDFNIYISDNNDRIGYRLDQAKAKYEALVWQLAAT